MTAAHGTYSRYQQGCRQECCRRAQALYQKRRELRRLRQGDLKVPLIGTQRRIQALMALGWSTGTMDRLLGRGTNYTIQFLKRTDGMFWRSTANLYADLYERLSMTLPPAETPSQRHSITKAQNTARRYGWAPPLAWDDIDDPNEQPKIAPEPVDDEMDEAAIQRRTLGDRNVRLTKAEAEELVRRWAASGRSLADCERITGLKPDRYLHRQEAS